MQKLALLALILIGASAAHAGIFIEPYAGYMTGNEKQQSTSNTDSGAVYGGRLGFEHMGFIVGADYMGGSLSIATQPTTNGSPSDIGAFMGYDTMMHLRVYAEYVISASEGESYTGFSDTDKGSGFKVGIGFHVLKMLAINAEYLANTYNKDNNGSLGNNVTESIYGVTISVPIYFGESAKSR